LQVCVACFDILSSGRLPKFAIANGNFIGPVPTCIEQLTRTEEIMIGLAHPQIFISKIRGGDNLRLNSHSYSFQSINGPIASQLPHQILELGLIKVSIIGALSNNQHTTIAQQYDARVPSILNGYNWLRTLDHNPLYSQFKNQEIAHDQLISQCKLINASLIDYMPDDDSTLLKDLNRHNQPDANETTDDSKDNSLQICRSNVITNAPIPNMSHLQISRSSKFVNDREKNFWLMNFVKLLPYGRGGHNESRRIPLSRHEFIQHMLQLTTPRFRTHHSFWATGYDIQSQSSASNALHVKTLISPAMTLRTLEVTSLELQTQLKYQEACFKNYSAYQPKPIQPKNSSSVFALNNILNCGQRASWGSSEERKALQREAFAMELEFGQFSIMLTVCPDSFSNYRIQLMTHIDSDYHFKLSTRHKNGIEINTLLDSIKLPSKSSNAECASSDPFSCAVYFDTIMSIIIEEVIGYDMSKQQANELPGLFGYPIAFLISTESQNSGNLHAHILINIHGLPETGKDYEDLTSYQKIQIEEYEERIKHVNMPISLNSCCPVCGELMDCVELPAKAYHIYRKGSIEYDVLKCSTCNLTKTCSKLILDAIGEDESVEARLIEYLRCSTDVLQYPTSTNDRASKQLSALLHLVQTHSWKHSLSCFKKNGRVSDGRCCRFLFPQILDENRSNGNQFLNPYVLVLALAFKCNTDFKLLIQGDQGNMARYCLKYATKPQKDVEDILTQYMQAFHRAIDRFPLSTDICDKSDEDIIREKKLIATKRLTSILNSMTRKHETASPMACLYLLKGTVFYKSHNFQNLNLTLMLSVFERNSMINVEIQLHQTTLGVYEYDSILQDYLNRNERLQQYCLFEFVKHFHVFKTSNPLKYLHFKSSYRKSTTHSVKMRKFPVIIVLLGKRIPDINQDSLPDDLIRYKETMLLLFEPFNDIKTLNTDNFDLIYNTWTNESPAWKFMKMNTAYYHSMIKSKV